MKRFMLLGLLGVMLSIVCLRHDASAQPGTQISLNVFYDRLSPYGDWMSYKSYGRVWRPRVDRDFVPYSTNGNWVYTDYGNTWVSDYDWGWAPFHYGRWTYDDYYGWIWIPDTEWAPAWVSWRSGGGYYGWAPLGPGMSINVNINIPLLRWIFCPAQYVLSPRISQYCMPRSRNTVIINNTTIINNIYHRNNGRYFGGPQHRDLERYTRQRVDVRRLNFQDRNPGRPNMGRDRLEFYRPSGRQDERNFADRDRRDKDQNPYFRNDKGNNRNGDYYGRNRYPGPNRPAQQNPGNRPGMPGSRPSDNERERPSTLPSGPGRERPVAAPSSPGRPNAGRPSYGIRDGERNSSSRGNWNNERNERDRRNWSSPSRPNERNMDRRPERSARQRDYIVNTPGESRSFEVRQTNNSNSGSPQPQHSRGERGNGRGGR